MAVFVKIISQNHFFQERHYYSSLSSPSQITMSILLKRQKQHDNTKSLSELKCSYSTPQTSLEACYYVVHPCVYWQAYISCLSSPSAVIVDIMRGWTFLQSGTEIRQDTVCDREENNAAPIRHVAHLITLASLLTGSLLIIIEPLGCPADRLNDWGGREAG